MRGKRLGIRSLGVGGQRKENKKSPGGSQKLQGWGKNEYGGKVVKTTEKKKRGGDAGGVVKG